MPRLRRAVVAGAWLAVASFALAVPLRVGADDTPLPPETVTNPDVVATTAVTTSVATTTEVAPTTTPAPTDSTAAATTTAEATTTAATTTTGDAATTAAATTATPSAAPSDVTEGERPARAPLPAVPAMRRVAPVTTTAKQPKAGASPSKTKAALRPALAAVVPETVTGVVTFHFPGPLPLRVTPPLEGGPYVFPVTGEPVWGDTYGAPRPDTASGWHHGDDIVATLGTPVVAVADGTLNRIGWDRLGGWGLWVQDRAGDEFYYAHLSGYSKLALLSTRVTAGEVIGFVGNTGDAFTTVPHLHFEIHPQGLLQLGYDGAVDPTSYLRSWRHVRTFVVGRPFHPPLPIEVAWRAEALQNFRELLDARGLDPPHQNPGRRAGQLTSESAAPSAGVMVVAAPPVAAAAVEGRRSQLWLGALLGALLLAVALLGALGWRRRRRAGSAAG